MKAKHKENAPAKKEEAAAEKAPEGSPREQKLTIGAFAAGGLAAGAVSYFMSAAYALPIGIIILFFVTTTLQKLTGKQKIGAWALGGIFLYLFVWLDMWVFLANFL